MASPVGSGRSGKPEIDFDQEVQARYLGKIGHPKTSEKVTRCAEHARDLQFHQDQYEKAGIRAKRLGDAALNARKSMIPLGDDPANIEADIGHNNLNLFVEAISKGGKTVALEEQKNALDSSLEAGRNLQKSRSIAQSAEKRARRQDRVVDAAKDAGVVFKTVAINAQRGAKVGLYTPLPGGAPVGAALGAVAGAAQAPGAVRRARGKRKEKRDAAYSEAVQETLRRRGARQL